MLSQTSPLRYFSALCSIQLACSFVMWLARYLFSQRQLNFLEPKGGICNYFATKTTIFSTHFIKTTENNRKNYFENPGKSTQNQHVALCLVLSPTQSHPSITGKTPIPSGKLCNLGMVSWENKRIGLSSSERVQSAFLGNSQG